MADLSKRARRFQRLLDERGLDLSVVELPDSTRTAAEAAAALGCSQAQIVKSLVFRNTDTDAPVIVLASGTQRVDENRLSQHVDAPVGRADADFVKRTTGFSIGGVAPIGHTQTFPVWVDRTLLAFDEVWAAAGTPHAVFRIDGPITDVLDAYRVIAVN